MYPHCQKSVYSTGILIIALFCNEYGITFIRRHAYKSGCRAFCTFSDKRIRFHTIKTGGKIENFIFIGALFAIFNIMREFIMVSGYRFLWPPLPTGRLYYSLGMLIMDIKTYQKEHCLLHWGYRFRNYFYSIGMICFFYRCIYRYYWQVSWWGRLRAVRRYIDTNPELFAYRHASRLHRCL